MALLASFQCLPDEILHGILSYFGNSTLRIFSLVNKRYRKVAIYPLFRHVNLGTWDAVELEKLYNDLLGDTSDINIRLSSRHLNTVSLQVPEDACDITEDGKISGFELRQQVVSKCFDRLKSIGTVQLEVSLADDGSIDTWNSMIKPAIKNLAKKFAGKVNNIELWIDSFATIDPDEAILALTTLKVSDVISSFPLSALRSLHLNSIQIDQENNAIVNVINSPFLHPLTLKTCWGDFFKWKPEYLRSLVVIWESSQKASEPPRSNFLLALKFMRSSALSLKSVSLQNIYEIHIAGPVPLESFVMAELVYLEVADSSERESLLNIILSIADTPKLRKLDFITEDAFSSDLRHLPDKIPSLRYKFREKRNDIIPSSGDATGYRATQEACRKNDIQLRTVYSAGHYDYLDDLLSELSRIRNLAEDLVDLALSLRSVALINIQSSQGIDFLNLCKLSITITDFAVPSEEVTEEDFTTKVPSLGDLFQVIEAASLRQLQLNYFAKNCSFLYELVNVLYERRFPRLELLGGAIVAFDNISVAEYKLLEAGIRLQCGLCGIDCTPLHFTSEKALLFDGDARDNEYVDKDAVIEEEEEYADESREEEEEEREELYEKDEKRNGTIASARR